MPKNEIREHAHRLFGQVHVGGLYWPAAVTEAMLMVLPARVVSVTARLARDAHVSADYVVLAAALAFGNGKVADAAREHLRAVHGEPT